MAILAEVKAAFHEVPLWGWGVLGLGGAYLYIRHASASAAVSSSGQTVAAPVTPVAASYDPTTGQALSGTAGGVDLGTYLAGSSAAIANEQASIDAMQQQNASLLGTVGDLQAQLLAAIASIGGTNGAPGGTPNPGPPPGGIGNPPAPGPPAPGGGGTPIPLPPVPQIAPPTAFGDAPPLPAPVSSNPYTATAAVPAFTTTPGPAWTPGPTIIEPWTDQPVPLPPINNPPSISPISTDGGNLWDVSHVVAPALNQFNAAGNPMPAPTPMPTLFFEPNVLTGKAPPPNPTPFQGGIPKYELPT